MHGDGPFAAISDDELLRRLVELLRKSRRVESALVAHIGEVDERRLYAREASPSMFAYCTEVLHLSEAEAYLRIAAARAARRHPVLLAMLADGRLHLSGIGKLAPHLNHDNAESLLRRAAHKSKRQIEELIAELAPQADVPARMRTLPERKPLTPLLGPDGVASSVPRLDLERGSPGVPKLRPDGVPDLALMPTQPSLTAKEPAALVEPLRLARYKVQFTASSELREKLERLRALMRGKVPDGDLAVIIEQAVTEKLERLEARRFAKTREPRKALTKTDRSTTAADAARSSSGPSSRHIPAAVRRAVRERDGNRCRFVSEQGRRCSARADLEYHHRHPFGLGGGHSLRNICLMCPVHNRYIAEHDYGREAIARRGATARYQRSGDRYPQISALLPSSRGQPIAATSAAQRGT